QIMTGVHSKRRQISLPKFEIEVFYHLQIKFLHHLPIDLCPGSVSDIGIVNKGIIENVFQFESHPLSNVERCIEFINRGRFEGIAVLPYGKFCSYAVVKIQRVIHGSLAEKYLIFLPTL